jgi:hypothetical protein
MKSQTRKLVMMMACALWAVPGWAKATTELQNGVPVTGLSDSQYGWKYFRISVPFEATVVRVDMNGMSGDADLYTRFGSAPTASTYYCRPYLGDSNETCVEDETETGYYYIGVYAWSSYSGVSLIATYFVDDPPVYDLIDENPLYDLSCPDHWWDYYRIYVPTQATNLDVEMGGGSGDADLYTRYEALPTSYNYDCVSQGYDSNEACYETETMEGYYYIGVYAWSSYSGVYLNADYY